MTGRAITRLLLCIGLLGLVSCGNPATVQHPGAVNAFDSNAYDSLMTAQASIEQAKTSLGPEFKTQLNAVIASYNTAMNAYKVYHMAATQGSAPDPAALQSQIDQLKTSVSALTAKAP